MTWRTLVSSGTTPTGLSIVQEEEGQRFLRVLSACCSALVEFDWERNTDWKCEKCQEPVEPNDGQSEYLEPDAPDWELNNWISVWTGLPEKDFKAERKI